MIATYALGLMSIRKAKQEIDPALRKDLLEMAGRWTKLARSYEFAEGLTRLTAQTR